MSSISIRVAAVAVAISVLATPTLRAQQHQHAQDTTKVDSAKKKATRQKPMNMKMDMGDSTKRRAKAAPSKPKKPVRAPATKKAAAGIAPDSARTPTADTMHMPMPLMGDSAQPRKADSAMVQMKDTAQMPMGGMHPPTDTSHSGMAMGDMMLPSVLGIPMERMGSGTTWLPDAVSLPSRHLPARGWDVMLHGFVFAQYDRQGGPRGDEQFGSLNWAMLMASRAMAGGMFQARTMLSLDPMTVGSSGYPLLLQSGETYQDRPLHDRQHPHDLWMEVAALYDHPITPNVAWSLYLAPSGEPALGPVAFMHRTSAMDIPTAGLTHHWQDATHISFGVVTAGLFTRRVKLEGSIFNGREPDEHRWNFDPIKLDSYSGRLTVNPDAHWSLTAGYGYLKSPEILHPDESMHRITASVLHGAKLGADGQWSSAFVWGANKHAGQSGMTHGVLAESEAVIDQSNTIFGRAEYVQKSAQDLVLDVALPPPPAGSTFPSDRIFNVSALSAGYIREVGRWRWATIGVGAQGTLNVVPSALENAYGSRTPLGGLVFVRLRPFHAPMTSMNGMETNKASGPKSHREHHE
jgi:hypothetical protein